MELSRPAFLPPSFLLRRSPPPPSLSSHLVPDVAVSLRQGSFVASLSNRPPSPHLRSPTPSASVRSGKPAEEHQHHALPTMVGRAPPHAGLLHQGRRAPSPLQRPRGRHYHRIRLASNSTLRPDSVQIPWGEEHCFDHSRIHQGHKEYVLGCWCLLELHLLHCSTQEACAHCIPENAEWSIIYLLVLDSLCMKCKTFLSLNLNQTEYQRNAHFDIEYIIFLYYTTYLEDVKHSFGWYILPQCKSIYVLLQFVL
ncbi:uncharacterized protein [Triticum aestivum]|uniref:uncharacterized protein n=1 Tax=Triticum aestivum TaxID=4565 RepID=UPI001D0130BB|nr:uncharacterized protein LOC123157637 [Triticum aestivum]